MEFDYITWSIWSIGFIILLVWIYIPIKEFRKLIKNRRASSQQKDGNNN